MHLPDGSLDGSQAAGWWIVTCGLLGFGINMVRINAKKLPALKVLLGLFAVISFVISMVHIPIPVIGSSAHMVGAAMIALLIGPKMLSVIIVVSLFIQALFFAHGGVTTLGANVLATWIGGFLGWISYKSLQSNIHLSRSNTGFLVLLFISGFIGSITVYLVSSFQLALSAGSELTMSNAWLSYFIPYLPTQVPMAVGEGILTAGVISFLIKKRPDLIRFFGKLSPINEQIMNISG